MKLLYDLTATQPSPESKFHGGGAYGEVVFFKMLEYLDDFQMYCIYDAKSYINPGILKAIEQHKIPLFDINTKSIDSVIKDNVIDRAYSAMLNLNQNWPLDSVQVYTTVHGLRTIEMPFEKTMLCYEHSLKQKIKDILFMTMAKDLYLKKMHTINGRIVRDSRIKTITISNHSLSSIHSFYPETREFNIPVFMTPLPPPPSFCHNEQYVNQTDNQNQASIETLNLKERKFFLLTSAARWIKNTLRAIQAFDSLFSDGTALSYKVVVTGVTDRRIFTKKLKNPDNFILPDWIRDEVYKVSHRQYSKGFFFGTPENSQYYENSGYIRNFDVVAVVEKCENGTVYCTQRNRFFKGDTVEILAPSQKPVILTRENIYDENGDEIETANHAMMKFSFKSDMVFPYGTVIRKELKD